MVGTGESTTNKFYDFTKTWFKPSSDPSAGETIAPPDSDRQVPFSQHSDDQGVISNKRQLNVTNLSQGDIVNKGCHIITLSSTLSQDSKGGANENLHA